MWILITLAAATFQILRTARQHELRRMLPVVPAGFVRYAYGFPLAVVASLVTFGVFGSELPSPPARFWPIIAGAGVAQILGTIALLRSFQLRDFAIGTVYVKTEVILVAVVSAVFLGEAMQPLGWVAAVVCMVGVAWLAAPDKITDALKMVGDPAALMGRGGRAGVRRCRSRNSRSIELARRRPRVEPSAADPDRDARHPDAGQRRATRRIRPVRTPRRVRQLARGDPGRSPERGRLGLLGGGGHVDHRHAGPDARPGRACLGLRHLGDLATRTTHPRRVRRERSRARRRDRAWSLLG